MNCREWRDNLMEFARGAQLEAGVRQALDAHVDGCPDCASLLAEQLALSAALGKLAVEATQVSPPEELEAALVAELDSVKRLRPRRWIPVVAGTIAASVVAGWFLVPRQAPAPPVRAPAARKEAAPPTRPVEPPARVAEQPFFAIPYTEPLSRYERASVVRMELPVAAVIATGLHVQTPDPSGRVSADVLIGQDGRARAIRFLSISTLNPDRRSDP